jgi:hypothetical protein
VACHVVDGEKMQRVDVGMESTRRRDSVDVGGLNDWILERKLGRRRILRSVDIGMKSGE